MEEQKERQYFENVELVVNKVEAKQDQDGTIFKIILETDKGKITYKPLSEKKEFVEGLAITSKAKAKIEDINPIIKEIGKKCNQFGFCKVFGTYQWWKPSENNADGNVYRYIQGTMIDKWKIVEEGNEEYVQ